MGLKMKLSLLVLVIGLVWHFGIPIEVDSILATFSDSKPTARTKPQPKTPEPVDLTKKSNKLWTEAELAAGKHQYVAVLGEVFDVRAKPSTYGEGGSYSFFTGVDGSRAYATGQFTAEGLIPDLTGLKPEDMSAVQGWHTFFSTSYPHSGYVVGHFYDEKGDPTEARLTAAEMFKEGEKTKLKEQSEKEKFPPCNSSWSEKEGKAIWCSNKSGGISRDWVGVPRKFKPSGGGGDRCACVHESLLDSPNLKVYDGCDPKSERCTWEPEGKDK